MERLSDTAIEIINELHTERLDYYSEYIPLIDAANRLAAYEDTGMEPEEINDMALEVATLKTIESMYGGLGKPDHIRDILQAEQDGRLVVLPCNVGDHVWADGREAIVVWFFGYKTERYLHAQFLDNAEYTDIPFCEIGKTVFLTRQEAEEAMAQEGGTNEDSCGM